MQILYASLGVLILWQVLRTRIDFLSIAAISFILYTSNCLIGRVWVSQSGRNVYEAPISAETYTLIIAQMIVILLFIIIARRRQTPLPDYRNSANGTDIRKREVTVSDFFWVVILLSSLICVIYDLLINIGVANFFSYTAKGDLLDRASVLFSISIWGGLLCFFHYYLAKETWGWALSSIIVIVSVLLGSRAYIATVLVGVLVIYSLGMNKEFGQEDEIERRKRVIWIAILMLVFLVLYKLIYKEIRAGDFLGAVDVLTNPKTWIGVLDVDELRIVCADYNYTVDNHIKLPTSDIIARMMSFVPFANDYFTTEFPIRFSAILQDRMHTSYGLANSFWGEAFAMGGFVSVLLATVLWLIIINFLNKRICTGRSPFLITVASYLCFYIHRLDWTQVIGCFKIVLLFFLVYQLFEFVFGNGISVSKTREKAKSSVYVSGKVDDVVGIPKHS